MLAPSSGRSADGPPRPRRDLRLGGFLPCGGRKAHVPRGAGPEQNRAARDRSLPASSPCLDPSSAFAVFPRIPEAVTHPRYHPPACSVAPSFSKVQNLYCKQDLTGQPSREEDSLQSAKFLLGVKFGSDSGIGDVFLGGVGGAHCPLLQGHLD